ncbi:MAG: 50S ribosomal protein L6 [Candidatus Marsarchaeota archaeon]|nr:50S ribosomal protein L6 [Candidatus Marsarchaeota archaeon]
MAEITLEKGVTATVVGDKVTVKGPLGANERRFNDALLKVTVEGSKLLVTQSPANKKLIKKAEVAEISLAKELSNDIKGVTKYFEVNMEAVYAHFPMTIEVKQGSIIIKNMLGERASRDAIMVGSTKAEAKDKKLRIYGTNLDDVKQTAANVRMACRVRHKDERIFQDGVYYSME